MRQFRLKITKPLIVLATVLVVQDSLKADPVRLSFLNNDTALKETLLFLKTAGCKNEALAAFQKEVEHYYSTPLKLDLSRFPQQQNGYYTFQSMTQLVATLPERLWEIPHPFELNCFDTAIVISEGKFCSSRSPDDHSGVFLPAGIIPNGEAVYFQATTAREAFNLSYPQYYLDASAGYIPPSIANARINLTAALYCFHMLPSMTNEQDVDKQVMSVLRSSWNEQGISFPPNFELVLCHQIKVANHLIFTSHAALLFPAKNRYTYIEKDGGQGPFVRLDFSNRTDLMKWLASHFIKGGCDYAFATFNDRKIEELQMTAE